LKTPPARVAERSTEAGPRAIGRGFTAPRIPLRDLRVLCHRHGRRFGALDLGSGADQLLGGAEIGHAFLAEDLEELNGILGQQYYAVVGDPPYITVKDRVVNRLYRERYPQSCHMKYALSFPFTERFFELALHSHPALPLGMNGSDAGYVGMITANSFISLGYASLTQPGLDYD
jgi:hypothetical protein